MLNTKISENCTIGDNCWMLFLIVRSRTTCQLQAGLLFKMYLYRDRPYSEKLYDSRLYEIIVLLLGRKWWSLVWNVWLVPLIVSRIDAITMFRVRMCLEFRSLYFEGDCGSEPSCLVFDCNGSLGGDWKQSVCQMHAGMLWQDSAGRHSEQNTLVHMQPRKECKDTGEINSFRDFQTCNS